jgi:hypothetical protein
MGLTMLSRKALNCWVQANLLHQPSEKLGLQVQATMPDSKISS